MFSMNPDPASWLTLEGGELAFDQYPDGSFQFRIVSTNPHIYCSVVLKSTLPAAIMAAGQVLDAWYSFHPTWKPALKIQTLPDQRGDNEGKPGACISSRVTARLIAALGFKSVAVYDVHSPDALAFLQRELDKVGAMLTVYSALECATMMRGMRPAPNSHIVAVDLGACDRATKFAQQYNADVIFMDKKRDPNGVIIGHRIVDHPHSNILRTPIEPDSEVWVVDDLCDGGATFVSVARAVRADFPNWKGKLKLYVTHGIFSKGREELLRHYSEVHSLFSYDDWRS